MSKFKKIFLFISISILLVIIFVFFLFFYKNDSSINSLEHFKVILGDEISGEKFLINQSGYDYYIKGYDYTDSYVLIKDSNLIITDEDIEYAKEKIKNKVNMYTLNGVNFKIYNLRDSLYNTVIDILWLKNFDYI